jgi:predicted TIM-barrel fold metal-dependent hydrolase
VHYVEAIGADRILLSWDYPHFDRTFPHSVDVLAKAGLSDEDFQKVTATNPLRLYGV